MSASDKQRFISPVKQCRIASLLQNSGIQTICFLTRKQHMQSSDASPENYVRLSHHEEIVNAIIHGAGFVLSLLAIAVTIQFVSTANSIAWGVYSASLLGVYGLSTLSHAVQRPQLKYLLGVWDQAAIYLLIAGTYTPVMWAFMPSHQRWLGLLVLWMVAFAGFFSKIILQHRVNAVSTYTYIALGWFPAMAVLSFISMPFLTWLALGGLSYTIGTVFLKIDHRFRYCHAVWHVFVILGSACHYYAIYAFILRKS